MPTRQSASTQESYLYPVSIRCKQDTKKDILYGIEKKEDEYHRMEHHETQQNYSLQGSISVASIPLSTSNWSMDGQTEEEEEQEEKQQLKQAFEEGEEELHLEEEQVKQLNEDTSDLKASGKRRSLKEWYNWFTTSQLWAHLLMLGSQLVFAGFCVLVPVALVCILFFIIFL